MILLKSKYYISKEDNIFFAKRTLVDNIYKSAVLEGIRVTIEDVYAFMQNVNTGTIWRPKMPSDVIMLQS